VPHRTLAGTHFPSHSGSEAELAWEYGALDIAGALTPDFIDSLWIKLMERN